MILIAAISLSLVACEGTRLVSAKRFSKNTNTEFKTFGFDEITKKVKVNRSDTEKTRAFLQTAIIQRMEEKGYTYSESNPDLLIDMELNYYKIQNNDRNYTHYSPYVGRTRYYYGRYNYRDFENERFAREENITASIELLFAEAEDKKQLWQGAVETKFTGKIKKRIVRLEDAIDKLILAFEEGTEK